MGWFSERLGWSRRRTGWQRAVVFRGLSHRELRWLERHLAKRSVSPAQQVVEEGKPADELILVESGSLELLKRDPATRVERTVGSVGPGEVLGDYAILDNKAWATSARATAQSTLLVLPMSALRGADRLRSGSIEQRVYREIENGLIASLTERARAHVDHALEHARRDGGDLHTVVALFELHRVATDDAGGNAGTGTVEHAEGHAQGFAQRAAQALAILR